MADPRPASFALRAVTAARPVRELAIRLELLRTVGARALLARRRQEAERARIGIEAARNSLYLRIWADAAEALGASVETLEDGALRLTRGSGAAVVRRQSLPLNDAAAIALAGDKAKVSSLLRADGLPVPAGARFSTRDVRPGLAFLAARGGPVVVKPRVDTAGGLGVTGGVRTPSDLLRASLKASRSGQELMVEEQVAGRVYRLLLLDGQLLDVIERGLPDVVGDGRTSVAGLIERENARRIANMRNEIGYLLRADLDTVLALREQRASLRSVPEAGRRLRVKTITSQNGPSDNATYRGSLAPELVREVRRATELTGLRLAGIDVVTPDPRRGMGETGGAILEINGVPGLTHHGQVKDPSAAPIVAIPILKALLDNAPPTIG